MKFPAVKVRRVMRALERNGWELLYQRGSHRKYKHKGTGNTFILSDHDSTEINSVKMKRYAKITGLKPEDL